MTTKKIPCACARCAERRKKRQKPAHAPRELTIPPAPVFTPWSRAQVYVVTYAQNATPVHEPFLKALRIYCKERKAELIVVAGRYTNPTSVFSHNMEHDEWWDERLGGLFRNRARIGKNLTVFGDVSIQPTATRPLSGFEVFAGEQSAVFGHPKLQLETVATSKRRYPRLFTTTGAVTVPNYTDSKAGKKGEAHHVFGATVIEVGTEGRYHARQINAAKDGSFIDLDRRWDEDGSTEALRALGVVHGDSHVRHADPLVERARGEIVALLGPERRVFHDVLDFDVRNHHTRDDFFDRFERGGFASDLVEVEVDEAIKYLDSGPNDCERVVVRSNHDEAFERWLNEVDGRKDPVNAAFWFETWHKMIEYRRTWGAWPGAFELHYGERGGGKVRFLKRGESYRIGGIECGYHGDKGIDGAFGSALNFSKLGGKSIIGHAHGPRIVDGCYQVGVGGLEQGYNEDAPSSWLSTDCAIYANSKRVLINMIDGEWRGA